MPGQSGTWLPKVTQAHTLIMWRLCKPVCKAAHGSEKGKTKSMAALTSGGSVKLPTSSKTPSTTLIRVRSTFNSSTRASTAGEMQTFLMIQTKGSTTHAATSCRRPARHTANLPHIQSDTANLPCIQSDAVRQADKHTCTRARCPCRTRSAPGHTDPLPLPEGSGGRGVTPRGGAGCSPTRAPAMTELTTYISIYS